MLPFSDFSISSFPFHSTWIVYCTVKTRFDLKPFHGRIALFNHHLCGSFGHLLPKHQLLPQPSTKPASKPSDAASGSSKLLNSFVMPGPCNSTQQQKHDVEIQPRSSAQELHFPWVSCLGTGAMVKIRCWAHVDYRYAPEIKACSLDMFDCDTTKIYPCILLTPQLLIQLRTLMPRS